MDIHRVWKFGAVAVAVVGLAGCGGGHRGGQAAAWCAGTARIDRTSIAETMARLGPPDKERPFTSSAVDGSPVTDDWFWYGGTVRLMFGPSGTLQAKVCDRASLRKVEAWVAKKP